MQDLVGDSLRVQSNVLIMVSFVAIVLVRLSRSTSMERTMTPMKRTKDSSLVSCLWELRDASRPSTLFAFAE